MRKAAVRHRLHQSELLPRKLFSRASGFVDAPLSCPAAGER